jgi:hypothetical protein
MGMIGATLLLPSDRVPYAVLERLGNSWFLKPVIEVSTSTGHSPARYHGDKPVWDHTYTEDELQKLILLNEETIAVRLKNGCYQDSEGLEYIIGVARYYRDYSD